MVISLLKSAIRIIFLVIVIVVLANVGYESYLRYEKGWQTNIVSPVGTILVEKHSIVEKSYMYFETMYFFPGGDNVRLSQLVVFDTDYWFYNSVLMRKPLTNSVLMDIDGNDAVDLITTVEDMTSPNPKNTIKCLDRKKIFADALKVCESADKYFKNTVSDYKLKEKADAFREKILREYEKKLNKKNEINL